MMAGQSKLGAKRSLSFTDPDAPTATKRIFERAKQASKLTASVEAPATPKADAATK